MKILCYNWKNFREIKINMQRSRDGFRDRVWSKLQVLEKAIAIDQ